ncbi:MAG: hypothetical protein ACK5TV_04270, partial [Phycisphaerales bacterium]|jgi:hypothetical protein
VKTRRLNLNVSRTRQIRLASSGGSMKFQNADGTKLPRFESLAYTGSRIEHPGFWDGVVVDLAGIDLREGKPRSFLRQHDESKILGHLESARVDTGQLYVAAVVSAIGYPEADLVVAMAKNGYSWEASIGIDVIETRELRAGEKTVVNGREVVGPVEIVTTSRLREVSLVAAGADPDTETRLAAQRAGETKEKRMGFEAWVKAKGKVLADLTDDEMTTLQAEYDAEQADAAKAGEAAAAGSGAATGVQAASRGRLAAANSRSTIQASDEELAQNLERQSKILEICGTTHLELAAKAIRNKWTAEKVELEVFKLKASSAPAAHINSGTTPGTIGLCLAAGLTAGVMKDDDRIRRFGAQAVEQGDRLSLGSSLQKTVRQFLAAHGEYSVNMSHTDELRAAKALDLQLRAQAKRTIQAASASTIPLASVFNSYVDARLREQWQRQPMTWRQFCSVRPVANFQPSKSYQIDLLGTMREVAKDGTIQDVSLQESEFTTQAKQIAGIVNITEVMYINDHLGALDRLPGMFAVHAAQQIEIDAYKVLFSMLGTEISAARKNYIEGADSAFSIESISALERLLMDQVDANGLPILLQPTKVLVTTKNKTAADLLYKAQQVNETTTANKPKLADNPHQGKLTPICSPFMSLTKFVPGSQEDNFAILGDSVMPVDMVFVQGNQDVTVEAVDAPADVLGFSIRAYARYGAGKGDGRGLAWSKGKA